MFVNKNRILIDSLISRKLKGKKKDVLGDFFIKPNIFKYEFEHYVLQITVSNFDTSVNFIKEDELFKNGGELKDSNEDGEMLLYYNIDEALSILRKEVIDLNNMVKQMKKTDKKMFNF